jgi:hypothetical protein
MAIEDAYQSALSAYQNACRELVAAGPDDRARASEAQIRAG